LAEPLITRRANSTKRRERVNFMAFSIWLYLGGDACPFGEPERVSGVGVLKENVGYRTDCNGTSVGRA